MSASSKPQPESHPQPESEPEPPPLRIALLSFPKCGRTWLKLMLKFYFERALGGAHEPPTQAPCEPAPPLDLPLDRHREWHALDSRVPRIIVEHDGDPHFKTPDQIDVDAARFRRHRVLLLVRDPRDVMVSLFFEMTRRTRFYDEWGFDTSAVRQGTEDLSTFVRGDVGRLRSLIAYWTQWLDRSGAAAAFRTVTYEQLHADTAGTLRAVLEFLGIHRDEVALERAVADCEFSKMREYEQAGRFASKSLEPGAADDPESFKTRRGVVGGYRDHFGADDLAYIDEVCAALPPPLDGYRVGAP